MTPFHVAGIAFLFVGFALACYQGLQEFELVSDVSWITWTHIHFVTIGAFTQLLFGTLPQLTARNSSDRDRRHRLSAPFSSD
ncbi:hypothetical protein [Haloterrigena gelatinilytica]|uniref:hypothetical protein n=1 Tax=Haloterrigena gelatinilytica TaxID=2741724 RepID=UPI0020C672F9|nr:hypothetical protein [Haloterrigena gelatinilytica]